MKKHILISILALALCSGAMAQGKRSSIYGKMPGKRAAEKTDSALAASEKLRDLFGGAASGNITTGSFGAYLCSKIHDTAFERVKEIRQRCDTVVELGTATDVRGITSQRRFGDNHKPVIVWVTIKCVDDTTWEPRTDIKLTPQDIINLKKFLRGKWAPPEPNWNGWINAQDAILKCWHMDTATRREDVR